MEKGKRIGDYEVLDELGRGGMGRVYRVRNVLSDRFEAMKVLLPGVLATDDLAARFLREIKVLAALHHPNIAALRTALTADGQVAMVMELVEGQSLSKRLARGPLDPADAVAYTGQVLSALAYAHGMGVIHRDIKPANMMLTDEGTVKLTDFGIARSQNDPQLTATGTTAGSLAYMSPEQVNGDPVDARSDLYSVGISLYEMTTGRPPFTGSSEFVLMSAHVTEPPTPPIDLRPDVPPALNTIILKAISKDPAERFQSADAFRAALTSMPAAPSMAAAPTLIRPAPAPQPSRASGPLPAARGGSTHRRYLVAGVLLFVAAAAAAGVYVQSASRAGGDAPAGQPARDGFAAALPPDVESSSAERTASVAPSPEPPGPEDGTQGTAATAAGAGRFSPESLGPATPGAGPAAVTRRSETGTRAAAPSVPGAAAPEATALAREPLPGAQDARGGSRGADQSATVPPATSVIEDLERDLDRASVRAAAVNDSLTVLQQGQARQGLGLRGDIAARQRSMNLNFVRAEEALTNGDTSRAQQYASEALADLDALERFLGR